MNLKKVIAASAVVLTICATTSVTALAAADKTPAEAVAGLTGRTVESVVAQRTETGKTYGTIAKEAGKLDEYKAEILQIKKENLNAQVANGTITKEKADEIIKALEANQLNCDGTGTAKIGQNMGAKFGSNGRGQGGGRGQGLRDGSCY